MTQLLTIAVIALSAVKYGGKRRVPGTETEKFEVPEDVLTDLLAAGAVRRADGVEEPAIDLAGAEEAHHAADLAKNLTDAQAALEAEVAQHEQTQASLDAAHAGLAEQINANTALKAELDKALADLAELQSKQAQGDAAGGAAGGEASTGAGAGAGADAPSTDASTGTTKATKARAAS